MNQREFIHNYIENTTEKFNPTLFNHSEADIINSLEKIILSCERTGLSTIKVLKFTVVDEYDEVIRILSDYESKRLLKASAKNKGLKVNKYDLIDMRSSAVKLLLVDYYIAAKGEQEVVQVIIAVPRVVNKFYFKLNGSLYSAMYQVVDASTYNTSTSKASNKHSITLKVIFQAIRIYRNITTIKTIDGQSLYCINYTNDTFKKSVPILQFMLAKFGFYGCLEFMNLNCITITDEAGMNDKIYGDDEYVFKVSKNKRIYIHVAKLMYDKVSVLQHLVWILIYVPSQSDVYQNMFSQTYWLAALGSIFNNNALPEEKGRNILSSLELIYDINTKEEIHLPEEYKYDSYCILRWMIWQYNDLRIKDNLNILTKKLRWGEYIAAKYGAKLSRSIYRLSDKGKDTDLKTIKRAICTDPMYLIQQMVLKDQLINFRGITTDMDSLLAIKFTYKGEAGIKTISNAYKLIHPTNLGILDPDSSSPSDPGSSGTIVPMVKLYDNNYFSKFEEPLTFEKDYATLYNTFKDIKGIKQICNLEEYMLGRKQKTAEEMIEQQKNIDAIRQIICTTGISAEEYAGLPLEGSGHIQYE